MEALLKSADKARVLRSAEYRYWLVHGWVAHQAQQGSSADDARAAFARLLPLLPWGRMHPRFVMEVLGYAADLRALGEQGCELHLSALRQAIAGGSGTSSSSSSSASRTAARRGSLFGQEIEALVRFPAAACRSLSTRAHCYGTVLLGCPLVLRLTKSYDASPTVKFGWQLALPDRQVPRPSALQHTDEAWRVDLEVSLAEASSATRTLLPRITNERAVPDDFMRTRADVMGQRWEEVFKAGSRYLNGKDELVLRVKVALHCQESPLLHNDYDIPPLDRTRSRPRPPRSFLAMLPPGHASDSEEDD